MKRFGFLLLILGLGSFVLPFFGLQFKILSLFGDNQPMVAIGAIVVGVLLLLIGGGKGAAEAADAA